MCVSVYLCNRTKRKTLFDTGAQCDEVLPSCVPFVLIYTHYLSIVSSAFAFQRTYIYGAHNFFSIWTLHLLLSSWTVVQSIFGWYHSLFEHRFRPIRRPFRTALDSGVTSVYLFHHWCVQRWNFICSNWNVKAFCLYFFKFSRFRSILFFIPLILFLQASRFKQNLKKKSSILWLTCDYKTARL